MIEMRPSKPEELAAERELWKVAFGDGEAEIDAFFARCAGPEDMLVLLEDGVVRSMLALLPMSILLPDGSSASSAYIYALATAPEERKKGFGRQLLRYADFYLQERGVDCVTVVPAEAGLHKFFATVDFAECFTTRKLELMESAAGRPGAGDCAERIGAHEYNLMRERLLAGTFHTRYSDALIAYQEEMACRSGGGLYSIKVGSAVGVAAAECTGRDGVVLKELLIAPEAQAGAVACIAAARKADRYFIRTPALWEGLPGSYPQTFAMVKWYQEAKRRVWSAETAGYFGLAFD